MPFENYTRLGGLHSETAAVGNILANAGVVAPHSGEPFSEAFLLGLGGGISAGYFAFQYGEISTLYVGSRGLWHQWDGSFIERMVTRLGGEVVVEETAGMLKAAKNLHDSVSAGVPVCTWVDSGLLPYWGGIPGSYGPHVVVVCGHDADHQTYELDDLAPSPWVVGVEQLGRARAQIRSLKNRMLTIQVPATVADLKPGILQGIRGCIEDMHNPRMKNFGITAIEKWSDLITNTKDKKGWPNVFPPGSNLYQALLYTHHWIEHAGTGGDAFRTMYGDFLAEAAPILGNQALAGLSKAYHALGKQWRDLADMALPDQAKPLAEAKALSRRKSHYLQRGGVAAAEEIERITQRLRQLEDDIQSGFPLSGQEIQGLLEQMKKQILAIYQAEIDALARLETAIP
jgi:hypothetical protein